MSWFKSWFDSPYYHMLYRHRDEEEAEEFIDHLVAFLRPPPEAHILDLACGRGRHAIYLNSKGYDVTGIDLSEENIRHCLSFENPHLSFFVHDMRRLFRVRDFDYIFNLFTSFGYFEREKDNEATIHSAAQALKSGGMLIIDFLNVRYAESTLVPEETIVSDGIQFHIQRSLTNGWFEKEIRFTDRGHGYQFNERVRAFTRNDFQEFFTHCGLTAIHEFGDYRLTTFEPDHSPRLILLARKN